MNSSPPRFISATVLITGIRVPSLFISNSSCFITADFDFVGRSLEINKDSLLVPKISSFKTPANCKAAKLASAICRFFYR